MESETILTTVKIPSTVRPLLQRIGRLADETGASAYAVGGCVRDWLLGVGHLVDVDVTVEGPGIALARLIAAGLRGRVTAHEQFGTATVTLPGSAVRRVDVASCRKETYARAAAYPKVSPGTVEEDLFRRDFTVNAMALALNPGRLGVLVDPFDGTGDLRRKRLRMLHDRSFLDDPSRILRGIRFAQRFGLRWDPATATAARAAARQGALGWLNAGRLRRELERITEEPDPLACLTALAAVIGG